MAYTTEKTWTSETLTSSDLNTYLRDNVEYLYGKVSGLTYSGVALHRSSAASIPDSAYTNITWQVEDSDVGGWWSSGTVITVPSSAIPTGSTQIAILVLATIRFATNGTGGRALNLTINGSNEDATFLGAYSSDVTSVPLSTICFVSSGDELILQAYQGSGGALNMDVAKVRIARLGPVD